MLTAFDLCLGACGVILPLAGTAIDFVVDRLIAIIQVPWDAPFGISWHLESHRAFSCVSRQAA